MLKAPRAESPPYEAVASPNRCPGWFGDPGARQHAGPGGDSPGCRELELQSALPPLHPMHSARRSVSLLMLVMAVLPALAAGDARPRVTLALKGESAERALALL